MTKFFSAEYGVVGICILLTIMILARVGEFVWKIKEKRDNLSETTVNTLTVNLQNNTVALSLLNQRLESLEKAISEFAKIKLDLRRSFSALKEISGDKWPAIRDEIIKDGFTL